MNKTDKDYRRHLRANRVFRWLLGPLINCIFRFKAAPSTLPEGPCLVLANHNTDLDPALIQLSFRELLYFVASEHVFRAGLASRFLRRYFDPISRLKGSTDLGTVMEVLKRLKKGHKVCIFAEGNRSFNGQTCPISPATGKLCRISGVPLVTYKFEGGYFTSPRWSRSLRRGRMRGGVVRIYTAEMLRAMSDKEVSAAIARDLWEDAYARQALERTRFQGRRLAEGLERALFICPACHQIDSLKSHENELRCDCGLRAVYDEYGYLSGAPFDSVTAWDLWQDGQLEKIACSSVEGFVFGDPAVRLYQVLEGHTSQLLSEGPAAMYKDRLEAGGHVFPLTDIGGMAVYGAASIAFTSNGKHYEIKADPSFCGRKYLELYQKLKGRD